MIVITNRRDFYNSGLARKQEDLAAIDAQLAGSLSKVDELKLNRAAENLLSEIEELEKKLSEMDAKDDNSNVRHLHLEKSFQKIDFSKAKKIARSINDKLSNDSGAILLFLQRSTKQKGSYCINEVLDLLVSDRKIGEDILGDFRPYPVDLGSPISEFNEIEFSRRLASHLDSDSEKCLPSIIEKLCSSLRGGSTVFIRIESWDSVTDQENFLDWFLEEFWQPLISELNSVFNEFSRIRFIVALIAKRQVFDCSSLTSSFCTEDAFEPCKAIELPLPNWTIDDIRTWLINNQGLSNSDSEKFASQIHGESEGTPDTICSILEKKYKS